MYERFLALASVVLSSFTLACLFFLLLPTRALTHVHPRTYTRWTTSQPFFGGKKHKISCDLMNGSSKKVFLSVTGEWNGVLMAKHPSGQQEVFVDTKKLAILRKQVARIDDQEEHESRFLWKDLTLALKIHDVNLANVTKSNIEQRQRDLVEERREARVQWQQRVSPLPLCLVSSAADSFVSSLSLSSFPRALAAISTSTRTAMAGPTISRWSSACHVPNSAVLSSQVALYLRRRELVL